MSRRVAFHEAAHVVAAWALDITPTGASAVPGRHLGGVAFYEGNRLEELPAVDAVGLPLPCMPDALRGWAERRAVIALAGREGELLETVTPRAESTRPPAPAEVATTGPTLARKLADVHDRADAGKVQTDDEIATEAVWFMSADLEIIGHHLGLLRVVARDLIRRHAARVVRVAEALHAAGHLDGTDLLQLIEGTKDGNAHPQTAA
jgi:hypothetical protein